MGITAKELAKKLNLSEAAISMALNHKPGVSTTTRKKVLEEAEKWGYDFTRIAYHHSVSGKIYFAIFKKHGAVVADTPFFSEISEGIREKCKEKGYKLNICYLYGDESLEKQIDDIRYSDCIGLILLGTEMKKEDFEYFKNLNFPVIVLDAYFNWLEKGCILINNDQGAWLATDYLIRRTKKQPGYMHSSYTIPNFEERANGFFNAVRSHGMSPSKSIVHHLTPSAEGAFADMTAILEQHEDIAPCYFADNDLIAIGAMKALLRFGYRIPQDVAIIGFDNIPMSSYFEPSLTTVNVPKRYMGEMAVLRLIDILHAKQFVPIKLQVGTNLVIRKSV